jgi:hypothetical protein
VKKQPLWVAGIFIVALALVFWVAHCGWYGLSLEHKIDPILLLTLAATLYIAYFLQYYFVSKVAAEGSEKTILLDSLRDVFSMMRDLRDTLMLCHEAGGKVSTAQAKTIKRLFRQIANALDTLESTIGLSHCAALKEECKPIRDALFNYKSSATGGNFPTRPYDVNTAADQERTYKILSEKLHGLVFKITRP